MKTDEKAIQMKNFLKMKVEDVLPYGEKVEDNLPKLEVFKESMSGEGDKEAPKLELMNLPSQEGVYVWRSCAVLLLLGSLGWRYHELQVEG